MLRRTKQKRNCIDAKMLAKNLKFRNREPGFVGEAVQNTQLKEMPAVRMEIEMWQQFWHDPVRTLGPVYFGLAIVFVVTTIIRSRLEVRRKARATYVLSDGGLNSVRRRNRAV